MTRDPLPFARTAATSSMRPTDAVATLVGFHGYQENAAIHLDVLRRIAGRPAASNLISIQALNRFYTRANVVVAGWMTKEDRELAIADNIAYVAAVLDEVAERGRHHAAADLRRLLARRGHGLSGRGVRAAAVRRRDRARRRRAAGCRAGRGRLAARPAGPWHRRTRGTRKRRRPPIWSTLRGAGVTVDEHVFDGRSRVGRVVRRARRRVPG